MLGLRAAGIRVSSASVRQAAGPIVHAQTRNMATLKEIQMRLKSVSNIAKITKSMKMIASTKMNKAQRAMETARVYGESANVIFKHAETTTKLDGETALKPLVIAVSSDRGLCGGIHSSISKSVKKFAKETPSASIAILGDKAKSQISREARSQIAMHFSQVAKNVPTFTEASTIADTVLSSGVEFSNIVIVYNRFKSVISFDTTPMDVFTEKAISESSKITAYEFEDEVLKNLEEFSFANSLYWAISEGNASEMAAKRTAMENATKNANEMITKLTLSYNRTRQAAITNELCDIITGASAV